MKNIDNFKDYLLGNNCSKATIDSYSRTIKQLLTVLNKKPEDINKNDLNRYKLYAIKTKHYDTNTLTPKYCAINSFMEYLDKPYNLKPPTTRTKNKVPFTRDEIQQLFNASKENQRDHAILKTFYYTQLRRNEIINLNIKDVDFQRYKIRVNEGKGNQFAEINIHTVALDAIRDYLRVKGLPEAGHEKALFLSKYGRRISRTAIHYLIKKYAADVGIEKRVYPHLFRISSITHMAESGLNLEEIRQQSRHKRYETLQGYIQMSDQHVKDAYLKGLFFDKPQHSESKPDISESINKPELQTTQQVQTNSNLQQQLVQKLIDGEITNEAFLQATNLLKSENKTQGLTGYL